MTNKARSIPTILIISRRAASVHDPLGGGPSRSSSVLGAPDSEDSSVPALQGECLL